ncbi:MAG: HEAT repeat domain-containing protein [Myxococcales bacterium]|nr:HEAT repeat domain-containing protein [Myxococcales bacterium]
MSIRFDERDRESVLRDLKSSDEEVRRLAVERIEVVGTDAAIPLLIKRLGDFGWRVRKAAVERLAASTESARVAKALLVALSDGENPGRRNAAVEALVRCGPRVLPQLLGATASDDPDVRKLVVDTLAAIADPRIEEPLLRLLDDPDPNVRAAAAEGLGVVGGDAVVRALHKLAQCDSEDPLVRFSALHALGVRGDPLRASELAPLLDDPVLRPAALVLLGCPDDEEAADILLKALASPSRSTREAAMRSLIGLVARSDEPRSEQLAAKIREVARSSPFVVASAVEQLEEASLPARLILVQFLGLARSEAVVIPILLAGRDEALAEVALATLESLGELAETALDAAWRGFDSSSRRDACVLLGRTDGDPGAERLRNALEDADPEVRVAAARSLGQRRWVDAIPLLARRLEAAAVEDDFEGADEVLAVTEALIALTREDAEATARAIDLLSARLDAAPESVRFAIAQLLGGIGRPQDAPLIGRLLRDPVARVRGAAVDGAARLDPEAAAELLRLALGDESASVRAAAARTIGAFESVALLEDLRRFAEDEEPIVRSAVVRAVGRRLAGSDDGDERSVALSLLDAALRDEATVALAAVSALREIGGSEASRVAAVLDRAEPELVQEAVGCLAAHADPTVVQALIPLVSHPDWSVRAEAIRTLSESRVARAVPAILRRLETEQDAFVRGEILRALERLEG